MGKVEGLLDFRASRETVSGPGYVWRDGTLLLNGLEIAPEEGVSGICLPAEARVIVSGNNAIRVRGESVAGIYGLKGLSITGNGSLAIEAKGRFGRGIDVESYGNGIHMQGISLSVAMEPSARAYAVAAYGPVHLEECSVAFTVGGQGAGFYSQKHVICKSCTLNLRCASSCIYADSHITLMRCEAHALCASRKTIAALVVNFFDSRVSSSLREENTRRGRPHSGIASEHLIIAGSVVKAALASRQGGDMDARFRAVICDSMLEGPVVLGEMSCGSVHNASGKTIMVGDMREPSRLFALERGASFLGGQL